MLSEEERREVRKEFGALANMRPGELERWLETPASKAVGRKGPDGESVSHRAGRRIVELKRTKMDDLLDVDHAQMQEIVRYVEKRLAQRPAGDVRDTAWRRTLMNWGHDPLV